MLSSLRSPSLRRSHRGAGRGEGRAFYRKTFTPPAYLFGYEKDNPSYEYLKTQILDQPSNQYQGTETTYTANLREARVFFEEKLADASHDQVERWFKALTQRFLFNVYELEKELDVFVVFETMNNRGKQLSRLELLKNRLIYLSTLLLPPATDGDRQTLRRNVNDAWKTVYEFLGREQDHPLPDDDFLRAHWIMYFTYSREQAGQFAVFLLDEHFTTNAVSSAKLQPDDLQRYVDSIQQSVKAWHAIQFPHRGEGLADEIKQDLEQLSRVGLGAFEPLIMAVLQQGAQLPEVRGFLQAAARFVFVVARLSQRRADTGDSAFYWLAGTVFRKETTVAEATAFVDGKTAFFYSLEKAKAEMRDLFERSDGFYHWAGLRYLLFEYEQHLRAGAGMQAPKVSWEEFTAKQLRDHATIEHIYPATPVRGEWPTFDVHSEAEQHALRHSLGNLLALSQSRNSKFSNRPFATKKQDGADVRGYYNGSYSEIAVAQSPDWTPTTVLERGLEILKFLEDRWQVSLGERASKVQLLGLDFLEPPAAAPAPGAA